MPQRIVRDDFEKFHDYNCLIPERIIYFGAWDDADTEEGVDWRSTGRLIKNLLSLDKKQKSPIIIHWNSVGGDWYHGIGIYDLIRCMRSHVSMVGYGIVRSMGTVIMQGCDERLLLPNTTFMIHDGWEGHEEDIPKSYEAGGRESVYTRKKMYKIYLRRIKEKHPYKYKLSNIEKMCEYDNYMRAEQAVALGLADKVIERLP